MSEGAGELDARLRPLAGILGGAILGGTLYAFARGLLPGQFAFAAAAVGALAGLGARLVGAIGSPAQLRVLVFGSLFATVIGEYAIYAQQTPEVTFAAHLLANPGWLVFTILFLVAGIFLGVRLLVGIDPLSDVLTHGGAAVPPGAAGTECPRCGSLQTAPAEEAGAMVCMACDHGWRLSEAPPPGGSADPGS
ncbi:MAG: hypothetical protein R3F60_33240 [bacterium]